MKKMHSEEDIKKAALAEIDSPRLDITKQFFAVHALAKTDPVLLVQPDEERWLVYCGVHDEPYYWVVVVERASHELSATWGYCNPHSRVYLSISSPTLTPDTITEKLALNPTDATRKGEALPGPAGSEAGRCYEDHGWCYEQDLPLPMDFEDRLTSLLELLIKKKDAILELSGDTSMCINVPHYVHTDYSWGWHLNQRHTSLLGELRLELDVDLYVSGPQLSE